MAKYTIRFNYPGVVGKEERYMLQAIVSGQISGDGIFTQRCHRLLEHELGIPSVLLTSSCTHALEMAALLLDIQPGDEVIIPSFTFVSTVNAFVLRGARPIFVDIRPDTLNLDESQLEQLITPQTRAVVPVHYAGVGCEMDTILNVVRRHNIAIVEDNAHGLFAKYKGKYLGTLGTFATQSFHETKNFTCGEGGALLINNPQYIERAEVIREKGTNRSQFFRGEIDKYSWVDVSSSYLPSDILAAFLFAQLEVWREIQAKRERVWNYYNQSLQDWSQQNNVRLPFVPDYCEQSYHMFYLLLPSLAQRDAFIAHLRSQGINSVFHYLPLHLSAMGKQFGGKPGDCPVTEELSDCLVRLPFYNELSEPDQAYIVKAVTDFRIG